MSQPDYETLLDHTRALTWWRACELETAMLLVNASWGTQANGLPSTDRLTEAMSRADILEQTARLLKHDLQTVLAHVMRAEETEDSDTGEGPWCDDACERMKDAHGTCRHAA